MQPYLEDWRVLLQQAGHDPDSLKIITANNSSSNFNNHTYLVEIERRRDDGSWDLALLYRDMDAPAFSQRADPSSFDIAPPAHRLTARNPRRGCTPIPSTGNAST